MKIESLEKIEKLAKRREAKRKKKMKVSGKSVFSIKILKNKPKSS